MQINSVLSKYPPQKTRFQACLCRCYWFWIYRNAVIGFVWQWAIMQLSKSMTYHNNIIIALNLSAMEFPCAIYFTTIRCTNMSSCFWLYFTHSQSTSKKWELFGFVCTTGIVGFEVAYKRNTLFYGKLLSHGYASKKINLHFSAHFLITVFWCQSNCWYSTHVAVEKASNFLSVFVVEFHTQTLVTHIHIFRNVTTKNMPYINN